MLRQSVALAKHTQESTAASCGVWPSRQRAIMRRDDGMTTDWVIPPRSRRGIGWALWLGPLPIAPAQPRTPGAPPDPPQALFKDLFAAVQTAQIFSDGKEFPDAVPTEPPADILRLYHAERPASPAALRAFVEAHFALPSEGLGAPAPPDRVSIVAHIDGLWDPLTRTSTTSPPYSSLWAVPEPY